MPASSLLPEAAWSPRLLAQTRHHNSPSHGVALPCSGNDLFHSHSQTLPGSNAQLHVGERVLSHPRSVGTGFYRFHFMLS